VIYRFDQYAVDDREFRLSAGAVPVPLEPKSLRLLLYLVENRNRLVRKQELLDKVWPEAMVTENALTRSVGQLRKALNDDSHEPKFIETVPTAGYRFIAEVSVADGETIAPPKPQPHPQWASPQVLAWIAVATIAAAGSYLFFFHHNPKVLTEKDTVVLADFTNSTGDTVFDGTLRQGLSVQLEQSPFLSIVSDGRIRQTLKLMDQPADTKLTPEIARELCQRAGSEAVLDGSIAQIGTRYLLTLKAVLCSTGDTLASVEAQASDKNHVLDALGKTASEMRNKLGESLSTVQKFDTPLEQATTGSLEALQQYSLGRRVSAGADYAAAVPFYRRAISLDPKFAMAYARLGMNYRNLGENVLGAENNRKAYELRAQVSEWEKFYIDSHYHFVTTGNLEKAAQVCEIWAQSYPRDWVSRVDLADAYSKLGEYDKALSEALESVRLNPTAIGYESLFHQYLDLDRLNEARLTAEEAQARKLESPVLHYGLYRLDFLQNDATGMAQQVVWARGRPGAENVVLDLEADTAAYSGKPGQARELSRRAVVAAKRAEETEVAAGYQANAALRDALFGNPAEARGRAADALDSSNGPAVQFLAALALAFAGDSVRAGTLADDLGNRFPEHTIVQSYYVPTIRAQLALSRKDPSRAIEILQAASPYELSAGGRLYPVYVRGESYLAAHRGDKAAAEFQKILDHRGIVVNSPIGVLAHLGLGRAYALSGDKSKAKSAYQEFLSFWKDADPDPDIRILKQAKAEYAKLN
jgi:DNA-binding winged helix-turn-helix (wHTH) protein/tetratricopeptide (TPR) repeat protein